MPDPLYQPFKSIYSNNQYTVKFLELARLSWTNGMAAHRLLWLSEKYGDAIFVWMPGCEARVPLLPLKWLFLLFLFVASLLELFTLQQMGKGEHLIGVGEPTALVSQFSDG